MTDDYYQKKVEALLWFLYHQHGMNPHEIKQIIRKYSKQHLCYDVDYEWFTTTDEEVREEHAKAVPFI